MGPVIEVFCVMLRLGTMAFGGPAAHLAYFQAELIDKRKWLSQESYAELIAFCQFLPGPASSQVGMGVGLMRAGFLGMLAAWFAFSLPSVILLLGAAAGLGALSGMSSGWLHGLLAGVVAIVADAVLKMGRTLCPTARHLTLALAGAIGMLLIPGALSQLLVIVLGAVLGYLWLPRPEELVSASGHPRLGKRIMAAGWAILLAGVLLPIGLSSTSGNPEPSLLNVYASFAQTGSLVFGGGHVVLPMLEAQVVDPGWMSTEEFLSGYGVTQAMPGPIFTLGSFLGATIGAHVGAGAGNFLLYAMAALLGLFVPSFGFMCALYPLWHRMRSSQAARRALAGVNAAVIGLLIAALYDPVWTKAMNTEDARLSVSAALGAWLLLVVWRQPAWLVVLASAGAGAALQL